MENGVGGRRRGLCSRREEVGGGGVSMESGVGGRRRGVCSRR